MEGLAIKKMGLSFTNEEVLKMEEEKIHDSKEQRFEDILSELANTVLELQEWVLKIKLENEDLSKPMVGDKASPES